MDYVDALLPDVMFRAPDVPDTILRQMIRDGAFDFFKESEVWRIDTPPLFTFAEVDTYEIHFDQDVRIVRLHSVHIDKRSMELVETDELDDHRGDVAAVSNDHPHQLWLGPNARRGWAQINCAIAPTREQVQLPGHLVTDFRDALVAAALLRIYSSPGTGWFDSDVSAYYSATVQKEVLRGKRLSLNRRKETRRTVRYGGL